MHKTLRGVFSEPKPPPRRNFLRENVMKIKRMQQCCENIKPNESSLSSKASSMNNLAPKRPSFVTTVNPKQSVKVLPPQVKQNKPSNKLIGPKKPVVTKNVTKPISNSNSNKICVHKSESLSRPSSSMSNITVRDQCIQTEDNTKEETFLKDTIIRYPSSTTLSSNRHNPFNYNHNNNTRNEEIPLVGSLKKEGSAHSLGKSVSIVTPSDLDSRDGDLDDEERYKNKKRYPKETIGDYLRSNNKSPIIDRNDKRTLKGTNVDSFDIPANYKIGEVPKYLIHRKEELAKLQKSEPIDVNCPEGHIVLQEEDRLKTLDIAKRRFDSLINELNRMPMTSETFKTRNRKMEIEKELTKLEDSIRVFSRTKVYVKLTE